MKPGERHTAASRRRMSSSHVGESRSDETRRRMRAAQRKRRERDRLDRRGRMLFDARELELAADALRDGSAAMSGRFAGFTFTMASRTA